MVGDDFGPEDEGFAAFVEAYHSCSGSDVSDDDTAADEGYSAAVDVGLGGGPSSMVDRGRVVFSVDARSAYEQWQRFEYVGVPGNQWSAELPALAVADDRLVESDHLLLALGLSLPPYYLAGDYRPLERRAFVHPLLEHVGVELPDSYVESVGSEWEFVCQGFQAVPWQSCGGVGGGYRVGPWQLPAAVSPPWPLATPEVQRVVVSVQPRLGLTAGPLVDDLMGLLRSTESPVWDVRFADLSPDGWQRVMLPMALSLPLELQVAAVEREGVLDGGAACVHAIRMAAERGVLWPLPSSAGGWLRVDSAVVAYLVSLWGSLLEDELLECAAENGVPVQQWKSVWADRVESSTQAQELRALCVMLDCVLHKHHHWRTVHCRERFLLRECFRSWLVVAQSSRGTERAVHMLRRSRGGIGPEPESGGSTDESGAGSSTRSQARSKRRRAKRTSKQRQADRRQRQAMALVAGQAALARRRRRQQLAAGPMRPGPNGRERLSLLWRLWQKYMVIVAMHRAAVDVRENSRLADGGAFIGAVRRALASGRWVFPATAGDVLTAVEFYHPGSTNSGLVHVCTARLEGVVDADLTTNFHWSASTPAISVRGVRLQWVVFDAELPLPGTCLLGTRVGAVARVRLQVVEMERFGARVGQLTTRGPPFDGRLNVSGLVWDRSAAKAAEWSANLASGRAMHSQIDAYVGGDGGWASGEVDPDEDDYPSSGGSNGDDFGADDY